MIYNWTKKDSDLAELEGWNLFQCEGSRDGILQLQAIDEMENILDDIEAWKLVANGNKPHHLNAIGELKKHNPQEYHRVINSCKNFRDTLKLIVKFNVK